MSEFAEPLLTNDKKENGTKQNGNFKFYLGIFLLIIVNVLWVASSELTNYIFTNMEYNKPYMSTYIKFSMFSIYLLGFIVYSPWRRQLIRCACFDYPGQYHMLAETDTDTDDCPDYQIKDTLGTSFFIPAKLPKEDKKEETKVLKDKSVKFNNFAEVRHLQDDKNSYIARLNYGSSARIRQLLKREKGMLTIQQVVRISIPFAFVFFAGNVAYQYALSLAPVAIVNIFSNTSVLFTLFIAAIFPSTIGDRFNITKLLAVVILLSGLVLIVIGSTDDPKTLLNINDVTMRGILWSLGGALMYSVYVVMFARAVGGSDNNIDVSMFFGFIGLFTMFLLWPGLVLLNYLQIETFELPSNDQLVFLLFNGLIGTVISELLWLWGCLLTSSLYGTMSLSLTIPFSIIYDVILKKKTYSMMMILGSVHVFISLMLVAVLTAYRTYDPLKSLFRFICCSYKYKDGI